MKNKIVILLEIICICLIAYSIYLQKVEGKEMPEKSPIILFDDSVRGMINRIAPTFGQDPELISKITWCESRHEVVSHDGGRAKNITGIHNSTFKGWLPAYEKEMGETLDVHSTYHQIKMMSWAFSKGESYRKKWTTYVAYINGGSYTFYSKLLKGTFTAKCK